MQGGWYEGEGGVIDSFTGKFWFLSNYYDPCPVIYKGIRYRNSEAAYQAQKCQIEIDKYAFMNAQPDEAKKMGKRVALVRGWNRMRGQVMREIVHAKFTQHPELADRLARTGHEFLVEGNWWHDNYFGVCMCYECQRSVPYGRNVLGEILMEEREQIWQRGPGAAPEQ